MILGAQDPSFNQAQLLWMAAMRNNRETVRFLVRHPKITSNMCDPSKQFSIKPHALELVRDECAVRQNRQLNECVGGGGGNLEAR